MVMVLVRWWFNDGGDGGEMMVTLNKIIKIKPSNTRGNFQNDWQTWWNDKGSKGEKHIETTQVAVKHSEREREDKERSARPRKFNHERHTKQNLDEVLDITRDITAQSFWKQKRWQRQRKTDTISQYCHTSCDETRSRIFDWSKNMTMARICGMDGSVA